MIKAIIFDCWGTLFYQEPHPITLFAEKIGKEVHDYEFLKAFEKHFMLEKHYKLEVPIRELLEELGIRHSEGLVSELKAILERTLGSPKAFPETLKVLNELKKNHKLGLITNTFYQSFEALEKAFRVSEIFDAILKSFDTKILKPNPEVFELMLEKLGIKKDEALMVGDSLKDDVQAAETFGIKAVLIDRKGRHPKQSNRITSLEQLFAFI